ncbi:Protein kinase-like (PK-like) [Venustampulla echinocandica]|uniref:Autophagy-related protein 1 n=1 Tax=Venustampulla echinocandica TaxID=2656787 RepID=A0A370TSQ7_9HELO|nr:Protein kinase-like (PK-like) [Venustampulla echinocandica]RDL38567.1 Protein kinase-like (PK-like) [Venustampulla echinocandica]
MEEEPTQPGTYPSLTYFANTRPPRPSSFSDSIKAFQEYMSAHDPYYVATQLYNDERRFDQGNSGLSDEDAADIICILYPLSMPAYRAAHGIHKANPRNTLEAKGDVKIRERAIDSDDDANISKVAAEGLVSCAIVLRLSADLKDPLCGYQFGRNSQRCDFAIGHNEPSRRVSNIHFRIYINEHGIIMIEDQSTNGTVVDGVMLRAKEKENGLDYRRTLETGYQITLVMTPPEENYDFVAWMPQRSDASELVYQQNVTKFFLHLATLRDQRGAENAATGGGKGDPVNLFPTPGVGTPGGAPLSTFGKHLKEWKGGSKYNKVCCIGKGAFAVVYKVTAKFDGVPFAAKELEKRRFMKNGILDQKMDMEMTIMSRITHPHIVQYIEHIDWEDYLYIIMEYIPGGDLGSLIHERGRLPESDVRDVGGQLLDALGYLHEKGITHRDVKPDNILISRREPLQVKLTDFGLSKMIDSEETFLRTFCGTLLYCAPEVYNEYREYDSTGKRTLRGPNRKSLPPQRYGHAVDVWSLAGVLFYALCGAPPYPVKNGTSYQELLNQVMTKPLDIRPLQRVNISDNGIRFVRQMLHVRPEHRATIEELQQSPWLTGVEDDVDVSMTQDEIDIPSNEEGSLDPQLEEGASQLSIADPVDRQINDSEEFGTSDETEIQLREIPSSFDTSNDASSYGFAYTSAPNHGPGRLFGEVNVSVVGSSGAILLDQLNLRIPANHHGIHHSLQISQDLEYSQDRTTTQYSHIDNSQLDGLDADVALPTTMEPAMHLPPVSPARDQDHDKRAIRSSSLMGTESLVGHLNMHSPASVASPPASSPAADNSRDVTISLRRPRPDDDDDSDDSWKPADLPPKRRRVSAREIDIPVPPSIFWDPADKSTHHYNYPRMMTSDYFNFKEYAKSKGEEFEPGTKTFESTMQSYRSSRSRSSSVEPVRAQSEPTADDGRRMTMKRDERRLVEGSSVREPKTIRRTIKDELIPSTAHPSNAPSPGADAGTTATPNIVPEPVVGNDFQLPKRILAKVLATPDSCLPTININITDCITSWGRGHSTTVRYSNGEETRIPKYAFKIMLFKPRFYRQIARKIQLWDEKDQDMSFYISTKASSGIWINDVHLPSYDRQNPNSYSRHWGELRHGDILTVWDDKTQGQATRFRFECLWGNSKEPRNSGEKFHTNTNLVFLADIEESCRTQELDILAEQEKRTEEHKKLMDDVKRNENAAAREVKLKSLNVFNQSFARDPPTA